MTTAASADSSSSAVPWRVAPIACADGDVDLALALADTAGAIILAVYASGFSVDRKVEDEPVTQADREANAAIVAALAQARPGDATLTEEAGFAAPPAWDGRRLWVVDPLDGTKEFIKRNGEFAVQIALVVDGQPRVGVVYAPALAQVWVARRGTGCWLWGESQWHRIEVPPRGSSGGVVAVSRSHPSPLSTAVAARLGFVGELPHGSVGLKLGALALGRAHLYLNDSNSTKAWDIAAPQVLLTEAGGIVTDLRGEPFFYDPARPRHQHGLLACADATVFAAARAAIAAVHPAV